jgi:hypothetical protein
MKRIDTLLRFPLLVFALSLVALWLSIRAGAYFRNHWKLEGDAREDFTVILTASLTMLGLIIGFTFSMAIGRYDQRKNYEAAEANAIGTEYNRTDLLPAADGAKVRALLKSYLDQRLLFYNALDAEQLRQIDDSTTRLQSDLWAACLGPAAAAPTAMTALAVSGMNQVLDSQGYTLAAWRNRIPTSAWILMELMSICCSLMIGYGARHAQVRAVPFLALPLLVSISFFLVADIDSPRGGLIHIRPQNLITVAESFHRH